MSTILSPEEPQSAEVVGAIAPRKLTAHDVAVEYGVPMSSIWRYCRTRAIPHARIGRTIRFDKAQLDAWFASGGASKSA